MASTTIVLAEPDQHTRAFLYDNLSADGHTVLTADDAREAIALLGREHPDIALIDAGDETLALLDNIRRDHGCGGADADTPILVLTGGADELQRVRLLDRGADDVVNKPFSYPELRARIGALLRRADTRARPRVLRAGPVSIDLQARQVRVGERQVALSAKEYGLLVALAAEPTRVFTKWELLREVWGFRSPGHTRTLESHAARLRGKLCEAGAQGVVLNVWGVGYRLVDGPLHRAPEHGAATALSA
jgi:DNA-binding response OmpR family regulator